MAFARLAIRLLPLFAATVLGGCAGAAADGVGAPAGGAARLARWSTLLHVRRPLDLTGPRGDGSLVLAAAGRLALLGRGGTVTPLAPAYSSPGGEEPYIAVVPDRGAGTCRFPSGTVYALRLHSGRGVVSISPSGAVGRLAAVTAPGLINGIAYDRTGRFGHRLLVTVNAGSRTTVDAIDCHGTVTTVTSLAPRVEGGLAVAPGRFGGFGGDLIAPDEISGRIYAVSPGGRSLLLASSGLPYGQDVGVESAGFVPSGPPQDALLADRLTPGNRHPGDDVVLRLSHTALAAAGVRAGDLLIATEGGARTDAIRCTAAGCSVRHVADGPPIAHAEGHIAFLSR